MGGFAEGWKSPLICSSRDKATMLDVYWKLPSPLLHRLDRGPIPNLLVLDFDAGFLYYSSCCLGIEPTTKNQHIALTKKYVGTMILVDEIGRQKPLANYIYAVLFKTWQELRTLEVVYPIWSNDWNLVLVVLLPRGLLIADSVLKPGIFLTGWRHLNGGVRELLVQRLDRGLLRFLPRLGREGDRLLRGLGWWRRWPPRGFCRHLRPDVSRLTDFLNFVFLAQFQLLYLSHTSRPRRRTEALSRFLGLGLLSKQPIGGRRWGGWLWLEMTTSTRDESFHPHNGFCLLLLRLVTSVKMERTNSWDKRRANQMGNRLRLLSHHGHKKMEGGMLLRDQFFMAWVQLQQQSTGMLVERSGVEGSGIIIVGHEGVGGLDERNCIVQLGNVESSLVEMANFRASCLQSGLHSTSTAKGALPRLEAWAWSSAQGESLMP